MESSSDMPSVHTDVVADVVCPWCYIGKRRLEKAIALTPGVNVTIKLAPLFPQSMDSARRHRPADLS
jgi:predicted DsbA family dithiol-disulfide isomerase